VPLLGAPAAVLHASQSVVTELQFVLQHTLSLQKPLAHWISPVHAAPFASGTTHTLPEQMLDAQLALTVQLVGHVVVLPLQRYGEHDGLPAEPAADVAWVQ